MAPTAATQPHRRRVHRIVFLPVDPVTGGTIDAGELSLTDGATELLFPAASDFIGNCGWEYDNEPDKYHFVNI